MNFQAKALAVTAGVIAVVSAWLLFFLVPYATGYGGVRESVAFNIGHMWALEEWQHCWMVPFASAVVVWLDRENLADLPVRGTGEGLIFVLFALLLYWTGYRTENVTISFFSAQILLAGLIIWLFGWHWMRALAFPWAFLVFMWPLLFLDNVIAFPLRLIMAKSSVMVLNIIGLPAVQDGSGILSAPNALMGLPEGKRFSVDVADPCSGIRSLFALTMVTALYAHFTLKTWWRQWLLFLSAVPLAILGNLCRIVMLVFGVIVIGPQAAIGSLEHPSLFHELAGYVVFIVALLGMVGLGAALVNIQNSRFDFRAGKEGTPESRSGQSDGDAVPRPPEKHQDLY